MAEDYYSVLGVDKEANQDTIKKEYRRLATEWHPDKHQEEEKKKEAEEKFKEISEAYSVLSDPDKRRNYDTTGSPDNSNPFGFSTTGNPFDILFNMRDHGEFQPRPSRGQSIQLQIELPLVEALFGTAHPISYWVRSACVPCSGRGGLEFEACAECNGSGFKTIRNANRMMQMTCDVCRGEANTVKTLCTSCEGRGILQESKNLNVVIPAGINHKTVLKLAGQGGNGFNGGPPGDVLVQVRVRVPDMSKFSKKEQETLKSLLSE